MARLFWLLWIGSAGMRYIKPNTPNLDSLMDIGAIGLMTTNVEVVFPKTMHI